MVILSSDNGDMVFKSIKQFDILFKNFRYGDIRHLRHGHAEIDDDNILIRIRKFEDIEYEMFFWFYVGTVLRKNIKFEIREKFKKPEFETFELLGDSFSQHKILREACRNVDFVDKFRYFLNELNNGWKDLALFHFCVYSNSIGRHLEYNLFSKEIETKCLKEKLSLITGLKY
jgi:hypothetical protein